MRVGKALTTFARYRTVTSLHAAGKTPTEIAISVGANPRHIYRVIKSARAWADENGIDFDPPKQLPSENNERGVVEPFMGWVVLVNEVLDYFGPGICKKYLNTNDQTLNAWRNADGSQAPTAKDREAIMVLVATMFVKKLDLDLIDLRMDSDDLEETRRRLGR